MDISRNRYGAIRSLEADYVRVVESRISSVFPKLRDLLARQRARSVLDYGGGDGLFCAEYLPRTVENAAHFDASANMRELARSRLGASARVQALASVAKVPTGAFDAVIMTAVWMEFPTERTAMRNLRTVGRALGPAGRFYAAVTHPCFREERFSTFRTDFRNDRYLSPGTRYLVTVCDGRTSAHFEDTHWNLDAMSRQLLRSGFLMRRLHEMPDARNGETSGRGSPWLIIEAELRPERG